MTDSSRKRRGSLTVEAALVLPAFMISLLTMASVLLMYVTAMRIQALLYTTASDMAIRIPSGESFNESSVRDGFTADLTDEDVRFIEGGRDGIELAAELDDTEFVKLSVRCDLVPLAGTGFLRIPFERSCIVHCMCGYENGFFVDDDIVYITEDSRVYHRNRNCSHIMLTIRETTSGQVLSLRNNSGGRYRPCESCHSSLSDEKLYITTDGDRYHNSITCSGLKRTVRSVRLSEVRDRRPCSRCGR